MKRAAFDDDVPLPPRGRAPEAVQALHLCRWCQDPTPTDVLANLGARCSHCYADYCRTMPAAPASPPAGVVPSNAGGAAWAYRLRWRHERGERLTMAQVSMYRETIDRLERGANVGAA